MFLVELRELSELLGGALHKSLMLLLELDADVKREMALSRSSGLLLEVALGSVLPNAALESLRRVSMADVSVENSSRLSDLFPSVAALASILSRRV